MGDSNPGDGICDDGNGNCTLGAAIQEANAAPGIDTIGFNIPGDGPYNIKPTRCPQLPTITDPVVIDGYTQPGARPNTNGPDQGSNAVLKIELDGGKITSPCTGLRIEAGNSTVRGLVIKRFQVGTANGIALGGGGNIVEGNFIGTHASGSFARGNTIGISVESHNNVIGGITPAARNVISGNQRGMWISGTGNLVIGNLIGTDAKATTRLGNDVGMFIDGSNNTIGGTTPEARNVISGNDDYGVWIFLASDNLVQGNYIGTDPKGTRALGNGTGVLMRERSINNTIGGTMPGSGNVISGNRNHGISIEIGPIGIGPTSPRASRKNLIQGNFIGTTASGIDALGNGSDGIQLSSPGNIIGGTTPWARNVISGNIGNGVKITDHQNQVLGNSIGTDVTGTKALGNGMSGVVIYRDFHRDINEQQASGDNIIGGAEAGAGNLISGNAKGVLVVESTENAISFNSIFSNTGLGIELMEGGNNIQSAPILTSVVAASSSVGGTLVNGTLNSKRETRFRLEFFLNTSCDPSSYGEGEVFLGQTDITTERNGVATFTARFDIPVPEGKTITATATDRYNNTSEFSQCYTVPSSA